MQTEHTALHTLRDKIKDYLDHAERDYYVGKDGRYAITQGSTAVFICPVQWEHYTLVQIFAPVAQDINSTCINAEFALFLTNLNNQLLFGKFSFDDSRQTIWCEHVLLGDFLDARELIVALEMVALTADRYDEIIAERTGGKRAIDKARERRF
jgi:hypothetical protein